MKKVAVTGASGFIAHHLISACQKRGYYVIGIDKRPIPDKHSKPQHFIQTDVADLGYRDLMGVDYLFHLAFSTNIGNSVRHPLKTTEENINMTIHLLEYAKDAGVGRVLFASTASLYSHNPTPWTEDMLPIPIEPYSWQKLSCEYACRMYEKAYRLPFVLVRLFQVFGEFQREDTAISVFLRLKAEDKPVLLMETKDQSRYRSGQRDFIYAGDVAEAMILLMEKEATGLYNVCSGKVNTIEEIAKTIKAKTKWIPTRPYDVDRHHGDNSKIKKLGWSPKTEVISWLKKQI